MKIISDIEALRAATKNQQDIAFVPTMGNLHQGHLSLIQEAKKQAQYVVVSIFINRLQFLPNEDFECYPRSFEADCQQLKKMKADIVFAPDEKILYPEKQTFTLALPPEADILEGKFRPKFFHGVTTVVLKLFNIVQPKIAIFGKKDFQQLHLIRKMVQQLNLPIKIVACETARLPSGLALSSRNQYLNESEQLQAPCLYKTLLAIKNKLETGEHHFDTLQTDAIKTLTQQKWRVDYIEIRQSQTLKQASSRSKELVVLGAAWLGKTRLIDNIELQLIK